MYRTGVRLAATLLAVAAMLAVHTPAASAHGATGQPIPDAQQYLSQITGISPETAGVSATIDPRGEWIQVTNNTAHILTVLGYLREPYLEITPNGVAENIYSPTLQLNQSLFGDLSQLGESSYPPIWRTTSTTSRSVLWHDHRIHWMTADRPPAVKAHPEIGRLIGKWQIHMTLDGKPVQISGSLSWLALAPTIDSSLSRVIAIGVSIFVVGLLTIIWWVVRRRRKSRTASTIVHVETPPGPEPEDLVREQPDVTNPTATGRSIGLETPLAPNGSGTQTPSVHTRR